MSHADSPTSYPLRWPDGWPRTLASERRHARFRSERGSVSTAMACDRLYRELDRLGVGRSDAVILSTNIMPTLRGVPRSGAVDPGDSGAAVYFTLNGRARVLACDTWIRLADNVAAIAAHIDAIRRIDRYGVGTLDQAFEGYRALPARGATWRTMLGFDAGAVVSSDRVLAAYRERARSAHPDMPTGSHEAMASLNAARDEALREIGG